MKKPPVLALITLVVLAFFRFAPAPTAPTVVVTHHFSSSPHMGSLDSAEAMYLRSWPADTDLVWRYVPSVPSQDTSGIVTDALVFPNIRGIVVDPATTPPPLVIGTINIEVQPQLPDTVAQGGWGVPDNVRMWGAIVFSVVVGLLALWMIFSRKFPPGHDRWAFGVIGLIGGYWLGP